MVTVPCKLASFTQGKISQPFVSPVSRVAAFPCSYQGSNNPDVYEEELVEVHDAFPTIENLHRILDQRPSIDIDPTILYGLVASARRAGHI